MTNRTVNLLLFIASFLLAGCSEERTTVYLADFEFQAQDLFTTSNRDTVPNHLHEFGEGFGGIETNGRWITAEEAVLRLAATGQRLRVEFDCSTTPGLSERGQALTIVWNGYDLGTHPVDQGWQRVMCVGRVPPIAIHEGVNEVVLRPAKGQMGEDGKHRSVFIKGVRLIAEFTVAERADWADLVAASVETDE
ncbi:MAG: hypothetical protein GY838_01225 [bacterium]|nr:hypothetical protein [bacterium]